MTEYLIDTAAAPSTTIATCATTQSNNANDTSSAITRPWTLLPDDLADDLDVDALLEQVQARRKKLEAAGRELAARHAFLERVWRSEHDDGVPLFLDTGATFYCHPAGAERLSMTFADEDAMSCELGAIAALERALVTYLHGGAETMAYFGLRLPAPEAPGVPRSERSGHASGRGLAPLSPRDYGIALIRYAEAIERELAETVTPEDVTCIRELEAELAEVRARITATSRAYAAPAQGCPFQRSA